MHCSQVYKRFALAPFCIYMVLHAQFAMAISQPPTTIHKQITKKGHATKPQLIAVAGTYDKSIDNSIQQLLDKGNTASSDGNKVDAINNYRQAIVLLEQYRPNRKSDLVNALINLGNLIEYDNFMQDECRSLFQQAARLTNNSDYKLKGVETLQLGIIEAQSNNLPKAENFCSQALPLIEKSSGAKSSLAGVVQYWLADIAFQERKYANAEKYAKQAINILSKQTDYQAYRASSLSMLAQVFMSQKKYIEAEGVYEQAIPSLKTSYGEDDLRLADCYKMLGCIQKIEGKTDEAANSWTKELAIRAKHPDEKQTFECFIGAPNYEQYYKEGVSYRKLKGNDFAVEVAYVWLPEYSCLRVDLLIINNSAVPVDILPENVKYVFFNPNRHELQQVCIEKFQSIMLKANTIAPGASQASTVCFKWDGAIQALTRSHLEVSIGTAKFIL